MDVAMLQIRSAPSRADALNNRTISSAVSSTIPADWGMSTRSKLLREQWHLCVQTLRLPDSWQAFLLFTLGVALACAGLLLHLQLSTTILQDKIQLEQLHAAERVIQEQNANLVWAIVQETELSKVKTRATELGYEAALQRNYIIIPGNTVAADSVTRPPHDQQSNLAQVNE
jgi:hypothetical protein